MEPTPIRTKKKIPAKIFLLVTLGLVTAGGVILMVMKTGFGNWGRNPFVGKVVEISGSVSAVGLVERYAKGKSIVVKSVDDNFETSVYCDLSGRHSIQVLADGVSEYRNRHPANRGRSEDIRLSVPQLLKPADEDLLFRKFKKLDKMEFGDLWPVPGIPDNAKVTVERDDENLGLYRANLGLHAELKNREAAEAFEGRVDGLARKADLMDVEWRRYKDSCLGRYPQGSARGRDWFGVWEGPPRIANETNPECLKIYDDFSRLSEEIRAGMSNALEEARGNGLRPDQIREIRKRYKMDWSGWEK